MRSVHIGQVIRIVLPQHIDFLGQHDPAAGLAMEVDRVAPVFYCGNYLFLEDAPGPVCRGFTFNANADPSSSSTACTLYRVRHGMPDGGGVIAERELTAADTRYTHYTMDKCQEPCVGSFADRTIMVPG